MDEQQLDKLINALKGQDKASQTTTLTGALAGKTVKEQEKILAQMGLRTRELKKNTKLTKKQTEALDDLNGVTVTVKQRFKGFAAEMSKVGSVFTPLLESAQKLADGQFNANDSITIMTGAFKNFGLVGGIIEQLGKSLDFNLDTFLELSQVGGTFGKDIIAMRIAAQDARLPLQEFAGLIADNSVALASLFGTTQQGIDRLVGFTRQLRDTAGKEGLYGLGVTTEELNEYLGTYLERQRFLGRTEELTQAELVKETIAYTRELDLLAKITGIQRKQIDDAVKAQQADAVFQRALRGMNEDQRKAANALIATLQKQNPALAEQAKSIIATGIGFGDFGDLLMGLNPQMTEIFRNFKGLVNSGAGASDILGMVGEAGKTFNEQFPDPLLFQFAGGAMQEFGNSMEIAATITDDQVRKIKEQQAEQSRLNAVLTPFREQVRGLQAEFAAVQTEFLRGITPLLEKFTTFITGPFKETIQRITNMLAEADPQKLANMLKNAFMGMVFFDLAKQVTTIAAGTRLGTQHLSQGTMFGQGLGLGKGGVLSKLIRGAGLAGAGFQAFGAGANLMDDDKSNNAAAIGTLAGTALGALFGPLGMLAGGFLGGKAGDFFGKFFDKREFGTLGATGRVSEPATRLLTIHKGERVLSPGETVDYNAMGIKDRDIGTGLENLLAKTRETADINQNMLLALNKLVAVNMATENNTRRTKNSLDNMGALV